MTTTAAAVHRSRTSTAAVPVVGMVIAVAVSDAVVHVVVVSTQVAIRVPASTTSPVVGIQPVVVHARGLLLLLHMHASSILATPTTTAVV